MLEHIDIDHQAIDQLCRLHHVNKLSLFGSVLRDDFSDDSDVDVLVEFDREHVPGFFELHRFESELSEVFGGRPVDVVTPKSLNRWIRPSVLEQAKVQYVE